MSQLLFNEVIYNNIPQNNFPLDHDRKFSMQMGYAVPCKVQEVVPGGTYYSNTSQLVRMAPMLAPLMHRVNVCVHSFFVPNRILWPGWEDAVASPLDPLNPMPFIKPAAGIGVGTLADYLGYPTGAFNDREFNALPIAAYNLIWNEYYRDQWLQEEINAELIDGNNNATADIGTAWVTKPLKRAWQKDYFTSCLPQPQAGEPVTIPIGGTATIEYNVAATGATTQLRRIGVAGQPAPASSGYVAGNISYSSDGVDDALLSALTGDPLGNEQPINIDNSANLLVNLESATATTINDLRVAITLQQWLEMNQRSGDRYIESLRSHFGVAPNDARLQRPEYIGGSKTNISFSEVLQTSSSDAETPQANMAGHGISLGQGNGYKYYAQEHGFIISIISVMPDTSYINPTPKHLLNRDFLEYLDPLFANLGEEPVLNREVQGDHTTPNGTFGYQSKFASYKFNHNTVHGQFKTTLKFWHMSRELLNPVLNENFIESDPTKRIFAVEDEDEDELYVQMYHEDRALLPLPRYSIPGVAKV
ncbi:major capsid protein [Blackfly microvirus SF02]|uniref:Major capsid protein n=1 Tax=Blackfly microvirus SF02 TaxID=2576452 RepID=A0A4P8PSI4_9VIRU|nr:major capsid protein [Blackfly microvirus SF02]